MDVVHWHKDWPAITLERFHTILLAEELLKEHEWLLFLDADMKVNSVVFSEEVLDDDKDFVAVHHPCHYNTGTGTFERRPESEACVTGEPLQYYQGCLWGGKMEAVIPMVKTMLMRTLHRILNRMTIQICPVAYSLHVVMSQPMTIQMLLWVSLMPSGLCSCLTEVLFL